MDRMQIIDVERNDRILRRGDRVAESPVTVPRIKGALRRATTARDVEKVLNENDLFEINWLTIGLLRARAVARIGGADRATAFLVSPSLLLTNNHVLPHRRAAKRSVAYFNDELDENGLDKAPVPFPLEPARFFLTDKALDFTLVGVPAEAAAQFGYCPLITKQGKTDVGDAVTIIQHPNGNKKQIAFRANRVTEILENHIRYETDTLGGSSGSPVFNDQWQAIALHHHSVARKDKDGHDLKRDGSPASDDTPADEIDWAMNQGVRVSRIVAAARAAELDQEFAKLRDELIEQP